MMKLRNPFLLMVISFLFVSSARSQDMTIGEVFNYEEGDEFHFMDTTTYLTDFPSVFKEVVRKKEVKSDSVYYEIEVITDDTVVHRMLIIALADTNKSVFDTTGLKLLNRRKLDYLRRRSVEYVYGFSDENNEILLFTDRFSKGLGVTYHSEQETGRRYAYKLVYYKSGKDSAGLPVNTMMERYQGEVEISIDPNPFSESTIVLFKNPPQGIEVMNLKMVNPDGLEVMDANIFPNVPHTIHAHESLEAGVYFLVFEAGDFKFVEMVEYKP